MKTLSVEINFNDFSEISVNSSRIDKDSYYSEIGFWGQPNVWQSFDLSDEKIEELEMKLEETLSGLDYTVRIDNNASMIF